MDNRLFMLLDDFFPSESTDRTQFFYRLSPFSCTGRGGFCDFRKMSFPAFVLIISLIVYPHLFGGNSKFRSGAAHACLRACDRRFFDHHEKNSGHKNNNITCIIV